MPVMAEMAELGNMAAAARLVEFTAKLAAVPEKLVAVPVDGRRCCSSDCRYVSTSSVGSSCGSVTPVCTGMVACMERWKSVDETGTARRYDVDTDDVRDDGRENSLSGGGGAPPRVVGT